MEGRGKEEYAELGGGHRVVMGSLGRNARRRGTVRRVEMRELDAASRHGFAGVRGLGQFGLRGSEWGQWDGRAAANTWYIETMGPSHG